MSTTIHLQDKYTGLKSTMFLSLDEINVLLQFLITEGTRVVMCNEYVVHIDKKPSAEQFVALTDGKADKNCLKFSPIIKNAYLNNNEYFAMWHDFKLDSERRALLSGYYFGKFGEVFEQRAPYRINNHKDILYSDLEIFIGEKKVFESVTHEYFAAADINGLEEKFIEFGDTPDANREIINKLDYAIPPEFLINSTAKITLSDGEIAATTTDGKTVLFKFSTDNYSIEKNTGFLGGKPEYVNGDISLIGANPCDFVSGKTYTIDDLCYDADVQGVTDIKHKDLPTFCELYLELSDENGKHCDLDLNSDKIFVIIK